MGFLYALWPSEPSILVFMKMSGNGSVSSCSGSVVCDCYAVYRWRVTYCDVFICGILLMCFLAISPTYHVQVINTLNQEDRVSSYKDTYPSLPDILRTMWLKQYDHRFRSPCCFLSSLRLSEIMALCRSVVKEINISSELHMFWRLIVEQKSRTLTVTYPQIYHLNSCDLSRRFY